MSFASLKKNRDKALSKLKSAAESQTKKSSYDDDSLWKPTVDKAGNGYAIIRFLPAGETTDLAWVRWWDHAFKGATGKWYFEKSRTTLGEPDPVSELNSQLWNSGIDADKEVARERKRKLHYASNILVIQDSANPDNEGKVFKYEYGAKIFEKIDQAMNPEFEDENPINPFDFWEGANFKLKIRQVSGYRNYDKSEFDEPSALLDGDDKKLEEVYNSMHDLSEYTDPSTFKSYEELKRKLNSVIGEPELPSETFEDELPSAKPKLNQNASQIVTSDDDDDLDFGSDDSDDELDMFAEMAAED